MALGGSGWLPPHSADLRPRRPESLTHHCSSCYWVVSEGWRLCMNGTGPGVRVTLCKSSAWGLSFPRVSERGLGGVLLAVPVGGCSRWGRPSCPEGRQAWAEGWSLRVSPSGRLLLLWYFWLVSVDPSPRPPFFLNTLAKHLAEK